MYNKCTVIAAGRHVHIAKLLMLCLPATVKQPRALSTGPTIELMMQEKHTPSLAGVAITLRETIVSLTCI